MKAVPYLTQRQGRFCIWLLMTVAPIIIGGTVLGFMAAGGLGGTLDFPTSQYLGFGAVSVALSAFLSAYTWFALSQ